MVRGLEGKNKSLGVRGIKVRGLETRVRVFGVSEKHKGLGR